MFSNLFAQKLVCVFFATFIGFAVNAQRPCTTEARMCPMGSNRLCPKVGGGCGVWRCDLCPSEPAPQDRMLCNSWVHWNCWDPTTGQYIPSPNSRR